MHRDLEESFVNLDRVASALNPPPGGSRWNLVAVQCAPVDIWCILYELPRLAPTLSAGVLVRRHFGFQDVPIATA